MRLLSRSFRIARIYGIDVRADLSWFFLAFIALSTLTSEFKRHLPDFTPPQHFALALMATVMFFVSLLAHEFGHSLVAKRKGLEVESITLFLFGGVARLRSDPQRPSHEFQVAIAGPLVSAALALVFFGFVLLADSTRMSAGNVLFSILATANLGLGLVNLVPGYPLDGGRILRSAIWAITGDVIKATKIAAVGGRIIGIAVMGAGVFWIFTGNAAVGFWWILIGMFLQGAAGSAHRMAIARGRSSQVCVRDVMTEDPATIPGNTRLGEALHDYFIALGRQDFPVVGYGGETEGLITLTIVKGAPEELLARTTVRQVMIKLTPEMIASPSERISDILPRLGINPWGRFIVMEDGKLVGLLTGAHLLEAVTTRGRS